MPRTLVARLVYCSSLLALGCGGEPSESAPEPKAADKAPEAPAEPPPPKVEPPKPPPFEWHVAMKLPAERKFDIVFQDRSRLIVDESTMWLDTDEKLIEVKRGSAEPPKVTELPKYHTLFGAHADELLFFDDKAIYARPKAGGEPTKRFDRPDMADPVVVGDRLTLTNWNQEKYILRHAPIAGGEFTTLELGPSILHRQAVVRGDAMLLVLDWGKIVRIAGDMTKLETVFELGADVPNQFVSDVAFVGDGIVFVLGEVDDDPTLTLVRQAADGTRTNLQEVPGDSRTTLVGDGERAYWQVAERGAWLVDAQTIQQVDLGGWTVQLTATSAGLAWVAGSEIRLAIPGSPGPELPKDAFGPEDPWGLAGLGPIKNPISHKTKVIGAVDQDIIRRIARAHISDVRKCEKKGKKSNPELSGSLELSFTINADGTVSDVAALEGPNSANEALVGCLVADVGTWKFVKPGRGGKAKVVHTFGFGEP